MEIVNVARSRKQPRIPVVLSKEKVAQVLILIDGTIGLIVKLLYAGGLRISEVVRLCVQDIDFDFKQITVRDGKGKKDRVTPLAKSLILPLQQHLQKINMIHNKDLKDGFGSVYLPYTLAKKYPSADIKNLIGSMFFPVEILPLTLEVASNVVITWISLLSIRQLKGRSNNVALLKKFQHILLGIHLLHIYCKRALIFALFKRCWDIVIYKRRCLCPYFFTTRRAGRGFTVG